MESSAFMIGLVTTLPTDILITQLKEATLDYEINPNEKSIRRLEYAAIVLVFKIRALSKNKSVAESAIDIAKEADAALRWEKLNPSNKENQS